MTTVAILKVSPHATKNPTVQVKLNSRFNWHRTEIDAFLRRAKTIIKITRNTRGVKVKKSLFDR